jgi:hypothetical protein
MTKTGMRSRIARMVMLLLIGVSLVGCSSSCNSPSFSLPPCPPVPTAPSYYPPPAQRASSTSMNFELSSEYIFQLVKSLVESPPNASTGINVTQASLSEQGTGNSAVNLLTIEFVPWIGNPQDELGGEPWQLVLAITPYLVNQDTVPDQATRMEILGGNGDEGLVLRFDFSDLLNATGADVTCSSATTTTDASVYFDQSVLAGILNQLGSVSPIIFPTGTLAQIANNIVSSSPPMDVTGVNIGSDGSLKLGFAFSNLPSCQGCQPAAPFDPSPYSYYPGAEQNVDWDWNLDIVQGFFTAVIQAQVSSELPKNASGATVTSVVPSFSASGIGLTIYGNVNGPCGSFNFSATTTLTLQIGTDPRGQSVLQDSQTKPQFDPGTGQGLKAACYALAQDFFSLWNALTVGVIISPSAGCANVLGGPVELSTASGDVLYGTSTYTALGDLVILGRSKLLDSIYGTRTIVPPCTAPA